MGEDGIRAYDFPTIIGDYLPLTFQTSLDADFYYSPSHPSPNTNIYFYDRSTGNPDAWSWNFGDGTTAVGKNQNHRYTQEGLYPVTLRISRLGIFFDSITKTIRVEETTIHNPHIPPLQPPNYPHGYTMEEIYSIVKADRLSIQNNPIKIVVMDSGIYPQTYESTSLLNIQRMYHPSYNDGVDYYGHGTFVNYEIAYLLQILAPNSEQISYKSFGNQGQCTAEIFIESLDDIKQLNPDIVSISAGAFGNPDDIYSRKIRELRDQGIIVICASGNAGPTSSTILSPACSPHTLSISASDPMMTILDPSDDLICSWSSRGPVTGLDEVKPDLTAPGESIRGPWLNYEKVTSGTSLSTPVISGGTAVIVSEHKTLIDIVKTLWFWNRAVVPEAYEDALEQSCITKGDQYSWGAGLIQLDQVSGHFYMNLLILILIPIIIITIILLAIIIYWKRDKIRGYLFP